MSEPAYFAENSLPLPTDGTPKLHHKIAGSLHDLVADIPVTKAVLDQIAYNTANVTLSAGSVTVNTAPLEALVADTNVILNDMDVDQQAGNVSLNSIDLKIAHCNTNDVNVTGSVLPDGAATDASVTSLAAVVATAGKQDTGNNSLATIAVKDFATQATLSALNDKVNTVNTGAVTVISQTLPAGASTSGRQDTANTTLNSLDTKISKCNTDAVIVSSSALPSGAATATKQDTGNTTLNDILNRTAPAYGFDAGGRARVSQITTLHDGKVTGGGTALIMQSAGTATFTLATDSKTTMAVTSGQFGIYYSKRFMPYPSGKSKFVEETFDTFGPQANVSKRVGYFSSNAVTPYDTSKDGFWLESASGTITLNMQRAGTSKISANITTWTGYANLGAYQTPSNWDNFTVVSFDFLWLGGATFRLWIKIGGVFVLAHEYYHVGVTSDTMIKDPSQTVRYEIRSTTGTGTFRYICSQVGTEGSTDNTGCQRSVSSGTTAIACASAGTSYPIKAIRKQSAYRQIPVQVTQFGLLVSSTNDIARFTLQKNPTLSAPLTYTNVTNSSVQEATGNGSITVTSLGTILATGYLTQNAVLPQGALSENFLAYLGSTIDNVMDEYVLCLTPVTASIDCFGLLTYKEF